MKAKYIGNTSLGHGDKDRWECPRCRKDPNKPECRFNLSPKKRGSKYPCRYCRQELKLVVK